MAAPILLDLTHTSHTGARTGVQRVCRALQRSLGGRARPVCLDPFLGAWRPLDESEAAGLASEDPAGGRGATWSFGTRLKGWGRRFLGSGHAGGASPSLCGAEAVLVPEIFAPGVGRRLRDLFTCTGGARVAVFHDAIALRYPELTAPATVARFPAYLKELLQFDGVAAVSESSRAALLDYWDWLGAKEAPPVAAIPLGIDPALASAPAQGALPTLLSVGTLEGRKNHRALLEACERLWEAGASFELRLVGMANRETSAAVLRRIGELRERGRRLRYDGPLAQRQLEEAYQACTFTVYPSLAEGFGLPVAESLARGRPCICRGDGALGEMARGGGCVVLSSGDAAELASAIAGLLSSPSALASLAAAAAARSFKTWDGYTAELLGWMAALPLRRAK